MKAYKEMTFDELLKYKERLIIDGIWADMDIDEKNEINDGLEKKFEQDKENK